MAQGKGRRAQRRGGPGSKPTLLAARQQRIVDVRPDPPDIRDRYYDAPLIQLKPFIAPPDGLHILDQETEGACTGFGLAAVINLLLTHAGLSHLKASQRMLYEMAKLHDEWPGQDYEGSSLRGAIRGWHSMGVCRDTSWPYKAKGTIGDLTIERAKEARAIALGAYFRLRANPTDYHAALCEASVLYVSANVHAGWSKPDRDTGVISYDPNDPTEGGHAFAIVGYNDKGFWVQNSWGKGWGKGGLALWTYEDWLDNVVDAWAVRLALSVPQIFGRVARDRDRQAAQRPELFSESVKRIDIAGHFVHVDDGLFAKRGEYWSTAEEVRETAELVARSPKYQHLLIYAHGGLNSPTDAARRIRAFREPFKRNGIYPYSIMYDTGIVEEMKDLLLNARQKAEGRAGGLRDFFDGLIEDFVRKPVTPLWDEMKRDARIPFERSGDGTRALGIFLDAFRKTDMKIHLAGHSTGAVLLGHLLAALDRDTGGGARIASCTLLAPACTVDFFKETYAPRLGKDVAKGTVRLPGLRVYNLTDEAEQADHVAYVYGKSLLYLVSRALERVRDKPLLGLARDGAKVAGRAGLKIIHAATGSTVSASTSHGGFDNDLPTMNGLLETILGHKAEKPFEAKEMEGY